MAAGVPQQKTTVSISRDIESKLGFPIPLPYSSLKADRICWNAKFLLPVGRNK